MNARKSPAQITSRRSLDFAQDVPKMVSAAGPFSPPRLLHQKKQIRGQARLHGLQRKPRRNHYLVSSTVKDAANLAYAWGRLLVDELVRLEVIHFCVAPGSRSSPLAAAIGVHPRAKNTVHFDERGCGFFALGLAGASRRPVAVVTTSGTAAANLFPAVIEASRKKIPLIILTADRPPELRSSGAHQTIDQDKRFGDNERFFFDLPVPDVSFPPEFVLTTVDQAVFKARGSPAGPVHLNCMFREPLHPYQAKVPEEYWKHVKRWLKDPAGPFTRHAQSEPDLSGEESERLASVLSQIRNGLVVAGKLSGRKDEQAVLELAAKLGWPIFADTVSGLRLGKTRGQVIAYFDQILLSGKWRKRLVAIDGVLHLGGRITSKRLNQLLEACRPSAYVMVLAHGLRHDPFHLVTERVQAPAAVFCRKVGERIKRPLTSFVLKGLQAADRKVETAVDNFLNQRKEISEPAVARIVTQAIPASHGLFLANSLPLREVDMYADRRHHGVVIGANRGASGIDGTLATACGFAAGLGSPATVLTGDLALLHDLNSLSLVKNSPQPLVIVAVNNDGGGIFSFLPIAGWKSEFERFFGTPHGYTFQAAAEMFSLIYKSPETIREFTTDYQKATSARASTLIEVKTNRDENVKLHRELQKVIVRALEK